MDARIKSLWVDALRSGEYEQGEGVLAEDGRYCCLGVLCEVAIKDGVPLKRVDQGEHYMSTLYGVGINLESHILPSVVTDWAGLNSDNPLVSVVVFAGDEEDIDVWLTYNEGMSLAEFNDNYGTFEDIADQIESEL